MNDCSQIMYIFDNYYHIIQLHYTDKIASKRLHQHTLLIMKRKQYVCNNKIKCFLLLPVLVGCWCGAVLEHRIDLHRHHVILTTQHRSAEEDSLIDIW